MFRSQLEAHFEFCDTSHRNAPKRREQKKKVCRAVRNEDTLLFTTRSAALCQLCGSVGTEEREINQADGERLAVMPVGRSLEKVLLGSCCCCDCCCCNTVPAGSAGSVHTCTLQDSSCFLLLNLCVSSALNERRDGVRRDGGKVSR